MSFSTNRSGAGMKVRGVLVLSESQKPLASVVDPAHGAVILIRPITLNRLVAKVEELVPPPGKSP